MWGRKGGGKKKRGGGLQTQWQGASSRPCEMPRDEVGELGSHQGRGREGHGKAHACREETG